MNQKNLDAIFNAYIEHFEFINNSDHDENYKWEIAARFQEFDLEAEDFVGMLSKMWKISDNLIDNSKELPFYALIAYARQEPETVRKMFRDLFHEGDNDVYAKQQRILDFIESSEQLRQKYLPYSHLYVNNQRSVMQLLFLRHPENNYGYKASQAKKFADCIGFYEDWGPMSNFKLDVYYKMCDQLVEKMKENQALMTTHQSRFNCDNRLMHPDNNLHILALDILYSSQTYDLYAGTSFNPINAQARKLHQERVAKAKELSEMAIEAAKESRLLTEAQLCFIDIFKKDTIIVHRRYGEGKVVSCDIFCNSLWLSAFFPNINEEKKIQLFVPLINKMLSCDVPDLNEKIEKYCEIMKRESVIADNLERATKQFQPYQEYLE